MVNEFCFNAHAVALFLRGFFHFKYNSFTFIFILMNWSRITVQQFQDIYRLHGDKEMDEMEKVEKVEQVISIMYGMTLRQVEDLTHPEFNAAARTCSMFLEQKDIPGKPVKHIRVGKRLYRIEYNPMKLKHRQYVEILTYGKKPIENMHLIMASLIQPVKWGFKRKNDVNSHDAYAEDMLNAPLVNVYHTAVFFCKLYTNLMKELEACLAGELMKNGNMNRTEAMEKVKALGQIGVGFIQPHKLRNMKD